MLPPSPSVMVFVGLTVGIKCVIQFGVYRAPRPTTRKYVRYTYAVCITDPGYVTLIFDGIVFSEFPRVFNARLGIIIGTGPSKARFEGEF